MTDPKPRTILLGNALVQTVPKPEKSTLPKTDDMPPSPLTNEQMWALGPRACAERWHALQAVYERVLQQVNGDEEEADHLFGPFGEERDVLESMLAALPGETTRRTQFVLEINTLLSEEAMDFVATAALLETQGLAPPDDVMEDFHQRATPLADRIFRWVLEQGWKPTTAIDPPEWGLSVTLGPEACDKALLRVWQVWGNEIRGKMMRARVMAILMDVGDAADYPDAWPGDASSEANA